MIDEAYRVIGDVTDEFAEILTTEALEFVADLEQSFGVRIDQLLTSREKLQNSLYKGEKLDFLEDTKHIRESEWQVSPIPQDLQDRRVEITGPAERKMIINALNSGAKVFMADLEDSLTPGWEQIIKAQINLRDAVNRNISFTSPEGKEYKLNDEIATMIVRPRGLHLFDKHVLINGKPIHGALLDFGLYFYHNARNLIAKNSGPYFYLPKIEHHLEARLWNDVFLYTQKKFGMDAGTIKATVLIETITAAFQMEEILYELKEHIVAQNAGRWDYIFSYIKKHSYDDKFVCPDRGTIIMTQPFLRAYSLLLIKTCHKRGALAMGGMSAFIPIKNDEKANDAAIKAVKADKTREATDGHDGTWVAHPGLIPVAMGIFDELMPTPNQIERKLDLVDVSAEDLLEVPKGEITESGLRNNISVCTQYLASWLNGNGCVPIFNLMEDAATAEIARTQIWQWIHHKASLNNGTEITVALFKKYRDEEMENIKKLVGAEYFAEHKNFYEKAATLLEKLVTDENLEEFLTIPAYEMVN